MTPPKQMLPQQGPQMMAPHNQMMGPQGQVLLQQNPMIEQIMTNQMQGNKQQFNTQNQSNVMPGPAQIMRGPTPNLQGNMVQFTGPMSGQMLPQQGPVNNSPSQVMGMQGQVLRPPGPSPHMAQQHGDPATTANNDVSLSQMMPDVSMQQSNMVPPTCRPCRGTVPRETISQAMGCPSMRLSTEHPMEIRCPVVRIQASQSIRMSR